MGGGPGPGMSSGERVEWSPPQPASAGRSSDATHEVARGPAMLHHARLRAACFTGGLSRRCARIEGVSTSVARERPRLGSRQPRAMHAPRATCAERAARERQALPSRSSFVGECVFHRCQRLSTSNAPERVRARLRAGSAAWSRTTAARYPTDPRRPRARAANTHAVAGPRPQRQRMSGLPWASAARRATMRDSPDSEFRQRAARPRVSRLARPPPNSGRSSPRPPETETPMRSSKRSRRASTRCGMTPPRAACAGPMSPGLYPRASSSSGNGPDASSAALPHAAL